MGAAQKHDKVTIKYANLQYTTYLYLALNCYRLLFDRIQFFCGGRIVVHYCHISTNNKNAYTMHIQALQEHKMVG